MKIKQFSRNMWMSDDEKTEIIIRLDGRAVRDGKMSGSFHFSSKHGEMMPHEDQFSIYVNGEIKVSRIFEDEIKQELRRLGFKF